MSSEPVAAATAQTAVRFDGVSKRFRKGFRYRSVREELSVAASTLFGGRRVVHAPEDFLALDDVTFKVATGEALGIVGSNGAGKSTTLKLIARVSSPDQGTIRVRGRVAALLEVGAGLHPELSGRDNVFLNGAILGMTRAEIERKYDDIVRFAEIADFMSMPVKRFSSGMYVRLGFSVAVHTDPDILLVDEVLSVGDMGFQAKSLDRMMEFRARGVTIVFVSHNLSLVAQMCDRVLWIEHGRALALGGTVEVVEAYQQFQDKKIQQAQATEDVQGRDVGVGDVVIEAITTHRADGSAAESFDYREPLLVRVHYKTFHRVARPYFVVQITHSLGYLFSASMFLDDDCPEWVEGRGFVEVLFETLPLLPGVFQIVGQIGRDVATSHFRPRVLASFRVASPLSAYGVKGLIGLGDLRNMPPVVVPYRWRFPR